jgi:hypothetical protein
VLGQVVLKRNTPPADLLWLNTYLTGCFLKTPARLPQYVAHAAKKRDDEAFFIAPGIFFSSVAGGPVSVF